MADPITPEWLTKVRTAYSRSLYERMSIGPNAHTALTAVPDLADEVDRLGAVMASAFDDLVNDRPHSAEQTLREALFIPAVEAVSG